MTDPVHENTPEETPETVTRHPEDWGTFFEGAILITYSRADAIADGVLVDVSDLAYDAGFRLPVAVTAALWGDLHAIPEESGQDVTGRLWDVLMVGRMAIAQAVAQGGGDGPELLYNLLLSRPGESDWYTVKSVIGPGDTGEPVLTLMRPDED